jgi:caa(3)-type oxidase subunit IV
MSDSNTHHHHPKEQHAHHYILPNWAAVAVGSTLLVLTVITVAVAHIDLGKLNFVVAMVVATIKGLLVATIFMNLRNDRRENGVIFATSFLFLAIFLVLTSTDLFFRGDVYVKGPIVPEQKSKVKDPWIQTPQLLAKGHQLFEVNCVTCHGPTGHGDGPASGALTPKPRNFTQDVGWKNGRKVTDVFKTLKEGVPGSAMASFATLPSDDRWALAHYVLSLGPKPPAATDADFAKIGVNPKAGGGEVKEASIPVEVAMARIAVAAEVPAHAAEARPQMGYVGEDVPAGARVYRQSCAGCHGAKGEGLVVRNLGVNPVVEIRTVPLTGSLESMQSADAFGKIVTRGLPGSLMPGSSELSSTQIRELYGFVRQLAQSH